MCVCVYIYIYNLGQNESNGQKFGSSCSLYGEQLFWGNLKGNNEEIRNGMFRDTLDIWKADHTTTSVIVRQAVFSVYPRLINWLFLSIREWSLFLVIEASQWLPCFWIVFVSLFVVCPLLSRACGTGFSKITIWRGWSSRTCWERQ